MTTTAGGPRSLLEIKQESVASGITVLHLVGRISMGRPCQEIEWHVDELIRLNTPRLILDLSEVQRVDSTGFGTIVTCSGKLRKAGGELHIAGAHGIVDEIANTSNLPKIIPFHATVAEAVASFT